MRHRPAVVVSLLAVLFGAQAAWSIATTSGTFDETTYLRLGRQLYTFHDGGETASWGVAPLPVLLTTAAPALAGWPDYPRAITLARASGLLLIAVPFIVVVFWTVLRAFGSAAATTATALAVLSPNLVAHAALATPDLCFVASALATLAALVSHVQTPSGRSRLLLVCALTISLAAKYTALALFVVVAVVLFAHRAEGDTRSALRRAIHAVLFSAAAFLIALSVGWMLHALTLVPYGLPPFHDMRMPASMVGLARQLHHQSLGEPAFLLGAHSTTSWWYYIPAALAMKSTPAELIVWIGAFAALGLGWRRLSARALVWRMAFFVFAAAALANRVALGVRYGLILVPLSLFLATEWWSTRSTRRSITVAVGASLVALQAVTAATIAPHDLSYFNLFAGGPEKGYMRLADSNIDWGQDLPALRDELRRLDARHPLLSYFGTAPVDAYGVQADRWDGSVRGDFTRWDWVAISATNLDGVFLTADPFIEFRGLTPAARAGYSIFLYPTSREDVRRAMATAASRFQ